MLLEGKQAVQIAQAQAPSAGRRIWDDITGLLFGRQEDQQPGASDALSMFWMSGD